MERDFILGVIGDFSGAGEVDPERFVEVDRDEWQSVFSRHAPRLSLALPFCDELHLAEWDDWHPDALVERVPSFGGLLAAREAVSDPGRARTLLAGAGVVLPQVEPAADPALTEPVAESALLDDILSGKGQDGAVRVVRPGSDPAFERMLHEIVAPHAERIDHARIQAWRDAIDGEIGTRMRALLGHPEVQSCEASWRSLRGLVWGSETGENLRIRILDLPRAALDEPDPREHALHRLVVEPKQDRLGGQPFGLLLADYAFGASDEDLAGLAHLARVSVDGDVPCLTGAAPELLREDDADAARAFLARARELPGAARVGLCGPRSLVRLPYGRAENPVDRFAFEEVDEDSDVSTYLWGNAAYAVAHAAVEAVAATGHARDARRFAERGFLPFHPRGRGLDPVGPTEQMLLDHEIERLQAAGLIPLAGVRGRDAAVVMAFQSLTGDSLLG